MFPYSNKTLIWACVVVFACAPAGLSQKKTTGVRQRKEVIEAYRVCNRFQRLLSENLDFDRAFDATFTRNPARRRAVAIVEGEFDSDTLTSVDSATVIDAFKSRMQLLFLMMPLFSPDSSEEAVMFFPPKIKAMLDRKPPEGPGEFASYAQQLRRDVADFRAHTEQLAQRFPNVAKRIEDFKRDLTTTISPPAQTVKPLTAYFRSQVLGPKEEYYQIGDFAVIREGQEMRIIGIRFFSRLF